MTSRPSTEAAHSREPGSAQSDPDGVHRRGRTTDVSTRPTRTSAPNSKGARTREALLQAAVRRFAVDGFRRTAVADVARDVGVTPTAAYAYFASKDALFAAAVDADAEGLVAVAAAVLAGAAESARPGAVVARMTSEVLAVVDRHPLALRVLAGHEELGPDQVLELPSLVGLRHAVTAALAEGKAAGRVRPDVDPETMALGLETIVLSQLATSLSLHVDRSEDRWRSVLTVIEAALTSPSAAI